MTDELDILEDLSSETPFGEGEELAIVSLALDSPDFFHTMGQYLDAKYFDNSQCKIVITAISQLYEKFDIVPSRDIIIDYVKKKISIDDYDDFKPILEVIERKSDPREVPVVKDVLIEWAKSQAYGQIYSDEGIDAYHAKEWGKLEEIMEKANRITDTSEEGLWFFENTEGLFAESTQEHFTSGFPKLDNWLNEGGPSRREVLVWMAPTGVGKSLIMVNTGIANIMKGKKVLHLTFETSREKIQQRYAGAISDVPIKERIPRREAVESSLQRFRVSYEGDLVIYEFPPEEVSVSEVYSIVDNLKKNKNWVPDIIVLDYLELMISKNKAYNSDGDEYKRQKKVTTEIRGLAANTNTLVVTATQTNRGGNADKNDKSASDTIDLNKIAESYGKTMPLDYIVSMNQSQDEYDQGTVRLYIAKNRNGPKFKICQARINYQTMKTKQIDVGTV